MTDQTAIEAATRRLTEALDALDAAVERRVELDQRRLKLAEQVHALGADRARLAAELDAQTAKTRRLESANQDIASRLDAAMENLQHVLEAQES